MILKDIVNLFYPDTCMHCGNHLNAHEAYLCMHCQIELPFTNFTAWVDNPVEQIFHGRFPLKEATALLFFRKQGITQHLIHRLKYKGDESIGTFLGELLGKAMQESGRFNALDGIIKVPLHPKKQKKRGYNQLDAFATALSKNLKIPVIEQVLIKTTHTETQTKKDRLHRFEKFNEKFLLSHPETIAGKRLLLIDDVITTGATLEACANELLQAKNTQISIATMAVPE